MKSLNISVSSCNRCFGQGIHELTEIARDLRKSQKLSFSNFIKFFWFQVGKLCLPACEAGNLDSFTASILVRVESFENVYHARLLARL